MSQSLPVASTEGGVAPNGGLASGLCVRGAFDWPLNLRGAEADGSGRPGGGGSCPRREAASYRPGGSAVGRALRLPVRYDASMCMAMMNSVTLRAPRCSVSERFHMRPRTSLGRRAFSKISFAFSPVCCQPAHKPRQGVGARRTRQDAMHGARLLEQARILGGLGRQERWYADRPTTAGLRRQGAGRLGREAGGGHVQALELGQRRSYTRGQQRAEQLGGRAHVRRKASSGAGSRPAW